MNAKLNTAYVRYSYANWKRFHEAGARRNR
jgi:hypothetical protein